MVDDPLSADAWKQLHERFKTKAASQLAKGKEKTPLDIVLDVSYEELGKEHKSYFLMLAVLACDTVVSIEMLSHLWGREVGNGVKKEGMMRAWTTNHASASRPIPAITVFMELYKYFVNLD